MATSEVTTADQLLGYREPGRHELVRGELRSVSAAGWWHGSVVGAIAGVLGTHIHRNKLGLALGAETGFVLARDPDTVRAPDFAFVAAHRIPRLAKGFFEGPPDLAVEVTSPNDTYAAVHEKALCWLAHGVKRVWVVELEARTVTVYRDRSRIRVLGPDEMLTGEDVLPGFEIGVAELFPLA